MEKLRINFILPPARNISGGPLAILEYATRFIARGHQVSITTYPDDQWSGERPFPWFDFPGPIYFKRRRERQRKDSYGQGRLLPENVLAGLPFPAPFDFLSRVLITASIDIIDVIPDCDLNIATFWTTAFPAFYSGKGKPVYFMQHYEEIFYALEPSNLLHRLGVRMSYGLPTYKVANSSWLKKQMLQKFGQDVPYSNNAIVVSDFAPAVKKSAADNIIRIVSYSHPLEWKGFADAVASMAKVREQYGSRIEWHVFGYQHPTLSEDNAFAPYIYHPDLSFAALASLYASSDIALCPSWYESFPLPPLEAMASGTAVVTTGEGTEDYAFDDHNALVVQARNIAQMTQAICRLIVDDELRRRLSVAGRKIAEQFNWDVAVQKREQILLEIHRGETSYDIFKSSKSGFVDSAGREFERAPADLPQLEEGLFWNGGNLYLLSNETKRQVVHSSLIPALLRQGFAYVDIDQLSIARTPTGAPLLSRADLPR